MKIYLTAALFFCFSSCVFSQDTKKAKSLIEQGIQLHDAGKYSNAISMYKQALEANSNDVSALYEMSYTYYISKNYDSSIFLSKQLIAMHAPDAVVKNVYVP